MRREKDEIFETFKKSVRRFDQICSEICHKKCDICHSVGLMIQITKIKEQQVCLRCKTKEYYRMANPLSMPTWNDGIKERYDMPQELQNLREGEKLLIQKVSVYLPLLHLQYGQLGIKGHVCCFPQDVQEVALFCLVYQNK